MVLAIANRQNLADQPHMQDGDEAEGMEPLYCHAVAPDANGSCVREPLGEAQVPLRLLAG